LHTTTEARMAGVMDPVGAQPWPTPRSVRRVLGKLEDAGIQPFRVPQLLG
jgi:hypothetical protein